MNWVVSVSKSFVEKLSYVEESFAFRKLNVDCLSNSFLFYSNLSFRVFITHLKFYGIFFYFIHLNTESLLNFTKENSHKRLINML